MSDDEYERGIDRVESIKEQLLETRESAILCNDEDIDRDAMMWGLADLLTEEIGYRVHIDVRDLDEHYSVYTLWRSKNPIAVEDTILAEERDWHQQTLRMGLLE